jgi:bifunctional non-homologous end joining protein LigD
MAKASKSVGFIETMDCLAVPEVPDGPEWTYEIKLDGFRVEAVKQHGKVTLYSRRGNVLNAKFPYIATALKELPDETILDGELVALDPKGRSVFNLLQNFRSAEAQIHYYAFDILALRGRDITELPLRERRQILNKTVSVNDHVNLSAVSPGPSAHILDFVKKHRLEGVVAKRDDSVYQPGKRTGLWKKHRISLGQEFVIGGYTAGTHGIDALIIGFYRGKELIYAARVRAGFVPATRRETFAKIKHLKTSTCPFANLPETTAGRWGQGLTAAKMKDCVWLRPEAVARVDFLEWTGADHLRHTKFVALREDKDPRKVVKET